MTKTHLFFTSIFLLSASCGLIPHRLTECSSERPCPNGQMCETSSSTCVESPVADPTMSMDGPALPVMVPDIVAPECLGDCLPCAQNKDCPSQACNYSQPSVIGGSCASSFEVVYVDNHNGSCAPTGDGESIATALCTLNEALSRIDGVRKRVIRVLPSTADYGSLTLMDQSVSLIGPGGVGGSALLRGGSADAVTIIGNSRVHIDGVDLTNSNVGILCRGGDSASLSLRKSRVVSNSDIGIVASGCTVSIDRVLLRDNGNGALGIGGKKGFSVTNSFIVKNRSYALPAIMITSTGYGTFDSNTVVDNTSYLSAGIECSQPSIEIKNSIVVRNSRYESQIKNCQLANSVVGIGDPAPGIHEEPKFVPIGDIDYGLDARPGYNYFCINQASCSQREDHFGIARPRGPKCDLGAHEAR